MRKLLLILGAGLLTLIVVGCYTMISHPTVGTMQSVHGEGRQCSDCHSDNEYYYYHYPYYYDSYWRYSGWWSYYCDPWWWHNYWNWPDPDYGVQLPVDRTQYYDQRTRPAATPGLLPGGTTTKSEGKDTPSQSDSGRDTKAKNEDRGRDRSGQPHSPPSNRPPRPTKRPEKPEKEPKKAKERE